MGAALLTAGGCTTLLGVDGNYHPVQTGGTGGAAPTGVGGGGAATGTGGDGTSMSASSSASASSTGNGCTPTGLSTCTATCGCGAAAKCAVTDETVGTMTCIPAGPVGPWGKCATNMDCDAATWCDHILNVCKPSCINNGQCPSSAQCIPATQKDGKTAVKNLTVCTAHCDPVTAAPCGTNTTCFYDSATVEFDCSTTLNLGENQSCWASNVCAIGLVCAGTSGAELCKQWCTPIDATFPNPACPSGRPYCDGLAQMVMYQGKSYGICNGP
jgi:hypothetical protein